VTRHARPFISTFKRHTHHFLEQLKFNCYFLNHVMCVLYIPGTSTKYNNGQCYLKPWPLHVRGNKKLGVIQSQSGFRRAKSLTSARNQTMIPQSPSPLPSHYTNYNTLTPCYKRKTSTSQNDKSFNVTNNSTQIYINLKTNLYMNP
jgi:hypothetical protein